MYQLGERERLIGIDSQTMTGPQIVKDEYEFEGNHLVQGLVDIPDGRRINSKMEIKGTIETNVRSVPKK